MHDVHLPFARHQAWRGVLLLCLSTLLLAGPAVAQDTTTPPAPIEAAEAAFNEGDLSHARSGFQALEADPDATVQGRAALGLAMIARQQFEYDRAKAQLSTAQERFKSAKADDWVGVVLLQRAEVARDTKEGLPAVLALLESASASLERAASSDELDDDKPRKNALKHWRALARQRLGDAVLDSDRGLAIRYYKRASALYAEVGATQREADIMFMLSRAYWLNKQFKNAQEKLLAALALYRKTDDKLSEGRCHSSIGQLWLLRGDNAKAHQAFKLAMTAFDGFATSAGETFEERRDELRRDELITHQGWAVALQEMKQYEDAALHLNKAQSHARALGLSDWSQRLDLSQARLDAARGEVDASIKKLAEVCPAMTEEPMEPRARCELLHGELLAKKEDHAAARTLLEGVLVKNKTIKSAEIDRRGMVTLAQVLLASNAVTEAGDVLLGALEAMDEEDAAGRAPLVAGLAKVAVSKKQSADAHRRYQEAEKLYKTLKDRPREAGMLLANGELYLSEEDWSRAKDDLKDAAKLYARLNDKAAAANAFALLAKANLGRGREGDALKAAKTSAKYYTALKDKDGAIATLLLVAEIQIADDEEEDALENVTAVLKMMPEGAEDANALKAQLTLGLFSRKGKDARPHLEEAIKIARKLSDDSALARGLAKLGYIELKSKEYEQALGHNQEAFQKMSALKDAAGAANAKLNEAFSYKGLKKKPEAIDAFKQAAQLFRAVPNGRPKRKRAEREAKKLKRSR